MKKSLLLLGLAMSLSIVAYAADLDPAKDLSKATDDVVVECAREEAHAFLLYTQAGFQ
jgi:hypothetical protein